MLKNCEASDYNHFQDEFGHHLPLHASSFMTKPAAHWPNVAVTVTKEPKP
jgi:hypothetical protein